MFFRLRAEDIMWENLRREENPDSNVISWSTRGVKVFKLKQPNTSRTPFPHRFAVTPPRGFNEPCNPLPTDGFWVHVYQTMVEVSTNVWITLNSKDIAKELKRICGSSYLPRSPPQHRTYEDNPNSRVNSLPNPNDKTRFLSRPFNREQAYPPNWKNQQPINSGYAQLYKPNITTVRPSHSSTTNMLSHAVPNAPIPLSQPPPLTHPILPNQPWPVLQQTNAYGWQPFYSPYPGQQHLRY